MEVCASTIIYAWSGGFVPVLWTHDPWWAACIYFSIFFALTWTASYRDHLEFPHHIHLHSGVIISFWLGAVLGMLLVWHLNIPQIFSAEPFEMHVHGNKRRPDKAQKHTSIVMSKTTFHIVSVGFGFLAQYFLFDSFSEYFSSRTITLVLAALFGAMYLIVNAASYFFGRDNAWYGYNSTYLSLVGLMLFSHNFGLGLVFLVRSKRVIKFWYGLIQFAFLATVFYPIMFFVLRRKMRTHGIWNIAGIKMLFVVTAVGHSFMYLVDFVLHVLWFMDEKRHPAFLLAGIAVYSLVFFIAVMIGTRWCCSRIK